MTLPLVVLAVLSTFGGLIGISYALSSAFTDHPVNYIEHTLDPIVHSVPPAATQSGEEGRPEMLSTPPQPIDGPPPLYPTDIPMEAAHSPEEVTTERLLALLSVLIAASGIGAGWLIFQKRPLLEMPRILENKYYVDEIYDAVIIHPIKAGSRDGLWKLFDVGVLDGLLHSLGEAVTESGRLVRQLQAGFVRAYAAIILIGALVLIGFFAYLAAELSH